MNQEPVTEQDDPIDLIARRIPPHLWVTMITVAVMLLSGWLFFKPPSAPPDEANAATASETLEGRVIEVLAEETLVVVGQEQAIQRVLVEITRGGQRGQRVEIEHGTATMLTDANRVKPGDRVLLERALEPDGERFYISDMVRWPALLGLALLFALAAMLVGRGVGLRALVSMSISVLAFVGFIIPGIRAGNSPLLICVLGALLLMTASLYLVYGWTWKTHVALAGLTLSLLVTAGLAVLFANLAHLGGLGSEEAGFLVSLGEGSIDLRGLLLGGIILGAVGVIDDVAVGQASATFELHRANPQLAWTQLFRHSMVIGNDHIASMTNTLLLAYVGASLPLFLLMANLDVPLMQTLNREFLAEEIVRTLIGSLGLILAVPATSLLASLVARRKKNRE